AFIQPGITTKAEVIENLGTPSFDMPEIRLIGYPWREVDYDLFWFAASNVGFFGAVTPLISYSYVLFVTFDDQDRVLASKIEKTLGTRITPIQELARDWVKQQGIVVSRPPRKFVALEVPPDQAVL